MKAVIGKLEIAVNATIELRGVKLEAYQDILNYILKVDPDAFQNAEAECIETPEPQVEEPKTKPKYAGPDKRLDILNSLLAEYDHDDKRYRLCELTFEQILDYIPELSGVSATAFGNRYRSIQRRDFYPFLKVRYIRSGNTLDLNVYTIPIRKKTYGYLIEKGRKAAGLTRGELCEMIHVPIEALTGWEADVFHPSHLSVNLLKTALGNDIFDELEE